MASKISIFQHQLDGDFSWRQGIPGSWGIPSRHCACFKTKSWSNDLDDLGCPKWLWKPPGLAIEIRETPLKIVRNITTQYFIGVIIIQIPLPEEWGAFTRSRTINNHLTELLIKKNCLFPNNMGHGWVWWKKTGIDNHKTGSKTQTLSINRTGLMQKQGMVIDQRRIERWLINVGSNPQN